MPQRGDPRAAHHSRARAGGVAKPAEPEPRRWGQAGEQVRPALQQSGDWEAGAQAGRGNATAPLRGNGSARVL